MAAAKTSEVTLKVKTGISEFEFLEGYVLKETILSSKRSATIGAIIYLSISTTVLGAEKVRNLNGFCRFLLDPLSEIQKLHGIFNGTKVDHRLAKKTALQVIDENKRLFHNLAQSLSQQVPREQKEEFIEEFYIDLLMRSDSILRRKARGETLNEIGQGHFAESDFAMSSQFLKNRLFQLEGAKINASSEDSLKDRIRKIDYALWVVTPN